MSNNNYQDKPLPSVELSLKFLSWDIKKLVEQVAELNNNFKIYIGMQRAKPSSNDAPPF